MLLDRASFERGSAAHSTPPSSDSIRTRFADIDGIRGLAIVAMVLYELHHHGLILATGLGGHAFEEGRRAIEFFFIISGFSLAYPVLASMRRYGCVRFDLGRYAIRRIARIVPTSWLVIAAVTIVPAIFSLVAPAHADPLLRMPSFATTLREVLFAQPPGAAPDAFWVVAVALRCYLLFPGLLWLWTRSPRAFLAVGAMAAVLDPLLHLQPYGLGELPAFMLGIVAADWRLRDEPFARWSLALAAPCAFAGIMIEPIVHSSLFADAPFAGDALAWQAAAFFFVTGTGFAVPVREALGGASLAELGEASFAIALAIEPVTLAVAPIVRAAAHGHGANSHATPLDALAVALCILATGVLLYRVIDRSLSERTPRMRIADRFDAPLEAIYALFHTSGSLVFGNPANLSVEPAETAAEPAAEDGALIRRTGLQMELEQEMSVAKRRLANQAAARIADPAFEAIRADVRAGNLSDAIAPASERNIWQKPRGITIDPAFMPPPLPSEPVVFESTPPAIAIEPHAIAIEPDAEPSAEPDTGVTAPRAIKFTIGRVDG